jgi:hypothetical protein
MFHDSWLHLFDQFAPIIGKQAAAFRPSLKPHGFERLARIDYSFTLLRPIGTWAVENEVLVDIVGLYMKRIGMNDKLVEFNEHSGICGALSKTFRGDELLGFLLPQVYSADCLRP